MNRRNFVRTLAAGLLIRPPRSARGDPRETGNPFVHTVTGPLATDALGITLMHEHVLVDFIGAAAVDPSRYDAEEVFRTVLPHLRKLRKLGCRSLVECTPAYIGRDPALLRRLSAASGVKLLTNTGYYGAAEDKFVPSHAYRESAAELAARWTTEFREGIGGTGIRPGFMKIGVDKGPLSEIDAKLVQAAALTHLKTGLTIASHTGDGVAAMEELDLLRGQGISASAFIWVHAQNEADLDLHLNAAARGAWVEFDGIRDSSLEKHLDFVRAMIDRGFLNRTLISQDAGWYHVGEPGGGRFREYGFLFTHFLPALRKAGVDERQIRSLLVDNPREALAIRVRRLNTGPDRL